MPGENDKWNWGTPWNGEKQDFEEMYKNSSAEWHKRYEQTKNVSIMAVKADPKNLIEIHKEDPKLAESIAKSQYNMSFDDAKKQIEWFKKPAGDWGNEDELADKIYTKIQAKSEQEKTKSTIDNFYSKNKIEWEFKEDFDWIYKDLIEWKTLTSSAAKKYLDIAFREVKQTSKNLEEHEKAVKTAKAWGLNSGKWDGGKTPRVEGRQILGQGTSKPGDWY